MIPAKRRRLKCHAPNRATSITLAGSDLIPRVQSAAFRFPLTEVLPMTLNQVDREIAGLIVNEQHRQESTLELIASENHVSPAVLEAAGSVLTNKYAEGYPGKR